MQADGRLDAQTRPGKIWMADIENDIRYQCRVGCLACDESKGDMTVWI
jgi:hypothetical protein